MLLPSADSSTHGRLDVYNRARLCPALEPIDLPPGEEDRLAALEVAFVEGERRAVGARALAAPREAGAFVEWFEGLEATGEGQHHPLFAWLACEATLDQMKWFLGQEVAGEAGFDDLVALTQVKMPPQVKLELGRNYWDELGQGHAGGMHGPMLGRLAASLGIAATPDRHVVWESLALGNLMIALAANRRYAYQSIGALGVIELTAPGRAARVNAGLQRLGIGGDVRRYFALHATLDVKHSAAWNREVIRPLVAADARVGPLIAEGALMRLRAGSRCFERYCRDLGLERRPCPV
jgi:hypothetical protein